MRAGKGLVRAGRQEHAAHEPLIGSVIVAEVPLAGLFFRSTLWGRRTPQIAR